MPVWDGKHEEEEEKKAEERNALLTESLCFFKNILLNFCCLGGLCLFLLFIFYFLYIVLCIKLPCEC